MTALVTTSRRSLLKNSAASAAALGLSGRFASAAAESVRIGVVYDLSGPFAGGGSAACAIGAQIAIDLVNERGGVAGKYKVVPVNVDCQSKVDVAINEVERLIDQEKLDIVTGVYASAQAVPLAAKVEAQKKILWITTAIATAVFKDKNLQYVFRAQIHSDQYGQAFATFIAENAKAKLGTEPKDTKVAIIHEDGPYGVGVADASERFGKERGLQILMSEGYSASTPDLSSLVTKLKRAGADVMVDIETAGRSLAALQADLLGGYALGVQTVVCRSGTPGAAGDYPDPYWIGEVDSVRLIAALAGLNEGADWRGVPAPGRTRFVVGACVHTAAADKSHELARCREKAEAGAHFLVTDVIYDLDVTVRLLSELRGHGVELPVLAVFAPFSDPKAVMRLIHEVPGAALASRPEAVRAGSDPVSAMLESVGRLRGLIGGVLIHPPAEPDEQMTSLVTELAGLRWAS